MQASLARGRTFFALQERKEKAERERKRDAVNDYLDKKDKNEDGMVTRDEHLASEVDKDAAGRKFDAANKNRDRSLTRSEIEDLLGCSRHRRPDHHVDGAMIPRFTRA